MESAVRTQEEIVSDIRAVSRDDTPASKARLDALVEEGLWAAHIRNLERTGELNVQTLPQAARKFIR